MEQEVQQPNAIDQGIQHMMPMVPNLQQQNTRGQDLPHPDSISKKMKAQKRKPYNTTKVFMKSDKKQVCKNCGCQKLNLNGGNIKSPSLKCSVCHKSSTLKNLAIDQKYLKVRGTCTECGSQNECFYRKILRTPRCYILDMLKENPDLTLDYYCYDCESFCYKIKPILQNK